MWLIYKAACIQSIQSKESWLRFRHHFIDQTVCISLKSNYFLLNVQCQSLPAVLARRVVDTIFPPNVQACTVSLCPLKLRAGPGIVLVQQNNCEYLPTATEVSSISPVDPTFEKEYITFQSSKVKKGVFRFSMRKLSCFVFWRSFQLGLRLRRMLACDNLCMNQRCERNSSLRKIPCRKSSSYFPIVLWKSRSEFFKTNIKFLSAYIYNLVEKYCLLWKT